MHVLVGMPVLDVQYSLYTVPMPVNNRTRLYILTEVLAVHVCLYRLCAVASECLPSIAE